MDLILKIWVGVTMAELTLIFAGYLVAIVTGKRKQAALKAWMEEFNGDNSPLRSHPS